MTRPDRPGHSSGTAVALLVLAAMTAALLFRYWPSDERAVRRHLANLAEVLSLPEREQQALRATRFAVLEEYFSPDVRVRFSGQDISPRTPLLDALRAWVPPPSGILVELSGVTVTFSEDKQDATVELEATVTEPQTIISPATGTTHQVRLAMVKRAGDWVIVDVTATDPRPAVLRGR